ncbi:MAG: CotH kinase family protein [Oscillospiraceae bacterium]|nr:CotH kinase family protein [Oscillospiraceae bacterium]
MSTHKHIDKICCIVLVLTLIVTILFMNGEILGIQKASAAPAYEAKLFDTSKVHKIEIIMDDWDSFIETCTNEEYSPCSVIIDNEAYKNVAIRAKGNTSLSSVRSYGNDRYSFKIEFDGYDSSKSYHGLDKLCLNNVIQDNTYMKDHLAFTMMREAGAVAPLSSFADIYINGEYFGLYLAVEGVEDAFLLRNYGKDYGELYKPDGMNMGGGRDKSENDNPGGFNPGDFNPRDFNPGDFNPENFNPENTATDAENSETKDKSRSFGGGMPGGGMGSSDVKLIYTDDNPESYPNIFGSAKTDVSENDQARLIASLKKLNENTDIESAVAVEDVIRYFVAHNFVLNFDSYTGSIIHNYYLHEKNGKLSMIPWDYNLAFGSFQSRSDATALINYPIDSPISGGTMESRPMLAWIFESEEYTNLYHKIFREFITNYFDSGKFEEMITSTYELIAPYVERDPSKFCTYEEFETAVSVLKDFCLLRAESVSGQLNGTIPSTSEAQAEDNSTFVSAENLAINTLGSMGFGGKNRDAVSAAKNEESPETKAPASSDVPQDMSNNPDMPPTAGNGARPQNNSGQTQKGDGATPENGNFPNRGAAPEGENRNFRGGMPGGGMPPPGMQTENQAENQLSETTLILISSIVLLLGLIFAFVYKRR